MNNEIVKLPDGQTIGAMAEMVYKSGFFGVKNAAEAGALLLIAQAEGKHPMKAIQEYDIVKGRPALKSSAIFGRFRAAGGRLQWLQTDDKVAKCHAEIDGSSIDITWDIAKAKQAGIYNTATAWGKYPAAMLRARAAAEAIRAIAPEVMAGMFAVEEVQDFDDKKPARGEPVRVGTIAEPEVIEPEIVATELSPECIAEIRACKTIEEISIKIKQWKSTQPLDLLVPLCSARKAEIVAEAAEQDKGGENE